MFYILDEWIINKENEGKVRDILNEMNRDVFIADENPIEEGMKRLEELGETTIIELINNGTIVFGA